MPPNPLKDLFASYQEIGSTGNEKYFRRAKPGGFDFFKSSNPLNPGAFKLSEADAMREIQAYHSRRTPARSAPSAPPSVYGGGGGGGYQAPVNIPTFDVGGAISRARQAAEAGVNPAYTLRLNRYLEQKNIERQRQQEDAKRSQEDLQKAFELFQETAELTRGRTQEDVAQNLQQVGTEEQQFQEDVGSGFDQARQALATDVAQSGLTGSGLGAQQQGQAVKERNVQEQRQTESFNVQKEAQERFKTRTFEDLTRREKVEGEETAKGKERVQINLDRFLDDLVREEAVERDRLDAERRAEINQETQRQQRLEFERFLSTLRSPAQVERANQIYGGSF